MINKVKFFLGANSHIGFVSYFEQLQNCYDNLQLLILKGGPGSGKSSLMKRVASFAQTLNHELEYIPCASDPTSLDAFIDKTQGFAMMDGTAPHVVDPQFPGAQQHIIYTGDGWDCEALNINRKDIRILNGKISDCHSSARAYIGAAASLLQENMLLSSRFINRSDIYSFAQEIINALPQSQSGIEHKRLLSAVSVGEVAFFENTLSSTANKIYAIDDRWGAAAGYLLRLICQGALGKGIDVITCPCSILPDKLEHIILPTEGIAITTANAFHSAQPLSDAVINGLYNKVSGVMQMERKCDFANSLIQEACQSVKGAKALHDELEQFYINAMDFSVLDKKYDEIITRFYK